jgi:hypothetical protein
MTDSKCPEPWNLFNSGIDPRGMGHVMPGRFPSATTKDPTYNHPSRECDLTAHATRR